MIREPKVVWNDTRRHVAGIGELEEHYPELAGEGARGFGSDGMEQEASRADGRDGGEKRDEERDEERPASSREEVV